MIGSDDNLGKAYKKKKRIEARLKFGEHYL